MRELIVDNFAGGGGASTGIELAIGRSVDIAINHDENAIAMHETNHPDTLHYCESVFDIDPVAATAGHPVGLAWFSPDCFPAGTLILTDKGYKEIETISAGDYVLTHKQRWKRVTDTNKTIKPLIELSGHGHYGIQCSPEHPFYIKRKSRIWNNNKRNYDHIYSEPEFAPSSVIGKDCYWSTPKNIPSLLIPELENTAKGNWLPVDERLMFLAGLYVGDGWTRLTDTRGELVLSFGQKKYDLLKDKINMWPRSGERASDGELSWYCREVRTGYQFSANNRGLVKWLRDNFGHGALNKTIPAWMFGSSNKFKKAFIDGYMSADGHKQVLKNGSACHEITTVSKKLAFGIKQLLSALNFIPTIYQSEQHTSFIEGRRVNVNNVYRVKWRPEICESHKQTFTENGLEWSAIKSNSKLEKISEVYNISVEDDESYVAEGIVVHNCTHFSKARGSTPVKKEIRGLAWIVVRWALLKRPRVIMLENVEEFKTWGPTKLNEDGNEFPDSTRAGETFRAFVDMLSTGIDENHPALDEVSEIIKLDRNGTEVKKLINGLGYQVEFKELKACDYGAPTIRKRFFMVMRCDSKQIFWPEVTHGDPKSDEVKTGKLLPYRTAAECIDWSLPCPSIFDRKKPLAENTLKRIARGIQRFVINNSNPFIVRIGQTGFGGDRLSYEIRSPLTTVTTKAEHLLVSPTIIQYHTERNVGEVRGQDLESPIKTVDTNPRYGLVTSFLAKHFGGNYKGAGSDINAPIGTVTTTDHNALVTSHLMELRGFCKDGRMLTGPVPTITASGAHLAQVNAFLLKYYGNEKECPSLDEPLHTVTSKDRFGLVTIHGVDYQIVDIGMRMLQPHELYKAQGFPDWYVIDQDYKGKKYPKSAQVARCGNAVPPPFAEALVRANLPEMCASKESKVA